MSAANRRYTQTKESVLVASGPSNAARKAVSCDQPSSVSASIGSPRPQCIANAEKK
jgi:hypothetical protein